MEKFDNILFNFQVDLVGSENVGRLGVVDKRLREVGKKLSFFIVRGVC